MAPTKFLVIKNTQTPGRSFKTNDGVVTKYSQEDFYFRVWLPIVYKSKFNLLIAPQYRTEQLDIEQASIAEANSMCNWNLRSLGFDLRSMIRLDSASWIISNINVSRSGNLADVPDHLIPLNFSLGSIYMKRKSDNEAYGFGVTFNKTYQRLSILPVFVYNYNFSSRSGIEISLPHKIAWRHNLSLKDIVYIKAEGSARNYTIYNNETLSNFRRTEMDLGLAYNKVLSKYAGLEFSAGYRQNLSLEYPINEITPVKKSGLVFSLEFYLRPPLK
jgi:hypothetical protein